MLGMELAWLIPFYCFIAFGVIALFTRGNGPLSAAISILAVVAGFITFWPVLFDMAGKGLPHYGSGEYHFFREWFSVSDMTVRWGMLVDPISVIMLGLVTLVAACVQIYSVAYMHGDRRYGWYFAVHSLFTASMLTLVLADNLILLYASWELVGVCSYLLIGFWYERRSASEAAKKAFVTTRIGDVGMLIGILLLFVNTGTFDISEILRRVMDPAAGQALSNTVLTGGALLLFMGAMGKSAQFPLHVWLPDAMEGPTPVSALIHAATMVVAGVFLVARMFPLFEAVPNVLTFVAVIGLITALIGATMALVMTDLKRILAYSTISHLGFMMVALGAGSYEAAVFYIVAHGLAKGLVFLGAGSIMHALHEQMDIRVMGGLRHRMPFTAGTFFVGAVALAGIPPLGVFFAKDEVLLAVKDGLGPVFTALFLLTAFLSAFYMARAVRLVFFGPLSHENEHVHESPPLMTMPLVLLAILAALIGVLVFSIGNYHGVANFLHPGEGHEFHFDPLWGTLSAVIAVGGFVLAWLLYSRPEGAPVRLQAQFAPVHRLFANKYYLDNLYQWVIDRVVLTFSGFIAFFDRTIVNDTGVNGTGNIVTVAGNRLRYHVTGKLYNYGLAMALGVIVIVLALWFRFRPD